MAYLSQNWLFYRKTICIKIASLQTRILYQNHHFKTTKNLSHRCRRHFPRCIKDNILRIYKDLNKRYPKSPKGIFQDFIFDMNSNIISYYITLISTSPLNCYMILYNYSLFMLTSPIRLCLRHSMGLRSMRLTQE